MDKHCVLLITLITTISSGLECRRERKIKQTKMSQPALQLANNTAFNNKVTSITSNEIPKVTLDVAETTELTKVLEEAEKRPDGRKATEYTPPEISIRPATANDVEKIDVNFDKADLSNILSWISNLFKVSFLTDDALNPVPQRGGKTYTVADKKITFKTHVPLTKRQVWDLFLTFLDLWGISIQRTSHPEIYQIVPTDNTAPNSVTKGSIPAYIGTNWEDLPDSDVYIRYVYFVKNASLSTLQTILNDLRSNTARLDAFPDLNAFIIADTASNIRSLMQIVDELDSLAMPEELVVLRLKNAVAQDVVSMYSTLVGDSEPKTPASILFGGKRIPKKMYFSSDTKLIPEPRTNSLVILGARDAVNKVVDFISTYIDTEIKQPYSPLYVYELQYASAADIKTLLEKVTAFSKDSAAAKNGGVLGNDKYLQPMTFEAEADGNRLIIRGEKEDYLRVRDLIKELDVKQPQVAIEVLIVDVMSEDNRELGIQMRNKRPNDIVKNMDFQNSGLPSAGGTSAGPVVSTTGSIAADLISLAVGQSVGSMLVSLGSASTGGVWAMFKILQTFAKTQIIANPFLIATNNYKATISIGQTRRIQTSLVVSGGPQQASFQDLSANLSLEVTPLINSEGIINLVINFQLVDFLNPVSNDPATNGERFAHYINTNASVANGEVLAFGGLLKTQENEQTTLAPVLGQIPLIGWFFKNKTKLKTKDNILIFISPRVVEPHPESGVGPYTEEKINVARQSMDLFHSANAHRDPINRWFFRDHSHEQEELVEDYITRKVYEAQEENKIIQKKLGEDQSGKVRKLNQRREKTSLTSIVNNNPEVSAGVK
jgi:general secretion pathway protein D